MNYTLSEALRSRKLPYGRTKAYEEINAGRLKALKSGRSTIITDEAIADHLAGLPAFEPKKAA